MDLRRTLKYMNMRTLAEKAEISYDVLRNYNCGRKEHLTDEETRKILVAMKQILGGIQ